MYTIKIAVRDLVAFTLRSGDLTSGFISGARLAESMRHHQGIQRSRRTAAPDDSVYLTEVALSCVVERGGVRLEIGGRIDGLVLNGDRVLIEEIKTTHSALDTLTESDRSLAWAQAQCYAFMYADQHGKDKVQVRLIYAQVDTRLTDVETRTFTRDELKEFFEGIVTAYISWALTLQAWSEARDASIRSLAFPFPSYRHGQQEFMEAVNGAIEGATSAFIEAPTGIGKTVAALFPAVHAIEKGDAAKIFYLTAKTTTRAIAENALARMRSQGLRLKSLTITAKEKTCFLQGGECDTAECPYALGYYDRLKDAIAELFREDALTRAVIEDCARKHSLCPFEFSLDASLWADCIIADYNYVFDPSVYLRRFFSGEETEAPEHILLIDEAHNLVDRAREMFSAELRKEDILALRKAVLPRAARAAGASRDVEQLHGTLSRINELLIEARKGCTEQGYAGTSDGYSVTRKAPEEWYPLLGTFVSQAEKFLVRDEPPVFGELLKEMYFEVYDFLRMADFYDEHYVTYAVRNANGLAVRLFCVDPSSLLEGVRRRGKAAVFFSATLTPLEYFRRVLGGNDESITLKLPSPFPPEHLCVLVDDTVSTRYRARSQSYGHIAALIRQAVSAKVGNYLVYFPSYAYLNEVAAAFAALRPEARIICQRQNMNDREREDFISRFDHFGTETLVAFAVLGGVFGEGIDLIGERLSGVVIVGVGLPQVSLERDIIRNYYDETMHSGYEFAYIFPGMNKVLQAAGRLIRTETDRGIILLIDDRYSRHPYRELLPEPWQPVKKVRGTPHGMLARTVAAFWDIVLPSGKTR